MDENTFYIRTIRIIAMLIACFIVSMRAGCSADKYISLKRDKTVFDALDDPIAQRLWAVGPALAQIQHSDYTERAKAKAKIVDDILKGGTVEEVMAAQGVLMGDAAKTNDLAQEIIEVGMEE